LGEYTTSGVEQVQFQSPVFQPGRDSLPATLPPNLILRPSVRADGSQDDFMRVPRRARPVRKQQRYKGCSTTSRQESRCSRPYARSSTTPGSMGSSSVGSIIRRKNARDIFDEYGIARPENWLSEEGSQSGGTRPLPQRQPPISITRLTYRICHSCRRRLTTGECPECGHESCIKCTDEMPLDSSSLINTAAHPHQLVRRHLRMIKRKRRLRN
jgi:hypothetical protein